VTTPALASGPCARATELIVAIERLVPELSAAEQLEVHNALVSLWKALLQQLLSPQVSPVDVSRERPDRLLTLEETAVHLRRSRSWVFHNWKRLGLGFRDGGRVRFRQSDVDRYVNARRRGQ